MTCFVFATRTVRTVHRRNKKKGTTEPSRRRERRSGREKEREREEK